MGRWLTSRWVPVFVGGVMSVAAQIFDLGSVVSALGLPIPDVAFRWLGLLIFLGGGAWIFRDYDRRCRPALEFREFGFVAGQFELPDTKVSAATVTLVNESGAHAPNVLVRVQQIVPILETRPQPFQPGNLELRPWHTDHRETRDLRPKQRLTIWIGFFADQDPDTFEVNWYQYRRPIGAPDTLVLGAYKVHLLAFANGSQSGDTWVLLDLNARTVTTCDLPALDYGDS